MAGGKGEQKAHCLVLPYPAQGHINPMLQFSKRLQHKGVRVTLVTTRFASRTMQRKCSSVAVENISDGYDEGGRQSAESAEAYLNRLRQVGSQTLEELTEKLRSNGVPPDCIVYDSFLPWALEVARKLGLFAVAFFTQAAAVDAIYYHVHKGALQLPLSQQKIVLPGLPPLQAADTPSFVYDFGSEPAVFQLVVGQFTNVDEADLVLCNTFYELEQETVCWMAKRWPLKTVGPTIPLAYLDKQVEDDKDYGFNLFEAKNEACMRWLNARPKGSVVYVSFGSLASLQAEQMEEVAWGLSSSESYFLWVIRSADEHKLPGKFMEEASEKGMVVPWCSQLEVLAHQAVGCFVTHCGWNSTLEALSLGVPMVTMPQRSDQFTNSKYVMDVWKIGLRAPADERGMVTREAVRGCIREIMESERGKEIRRSAQIWRSLARDAVSADGSSTRGIGDFVAKLRSFVNGQTISLSNMEEFATKS